MGPIQGIGWSDELSAREWVLFPIIQVHLQLLIIVRNLALHGQLQQYRHFILITYQMRTILSKFTASPKIPHFRFQFPLRPRILEECLSHLAHLSPKSSALFISLNGISQNPETSSTLRDAIKYQCDHKKIPLYAFLQDDINGLTYYIATASKHILANPFCKMGDLTVPIKSYTNIHKLLSYFGISYQRLGTPESALWNSHSEPTASENKFTKRWLDIIKQKLENQISKQRGISGTSLQQLGNKVLHPRQAQEARLIDSVSTLDEFKCLHFPNNKLKLYNFSSQARNFDFNKRQIQVLSQMVESMSLQKIMIMSMEHPITADVNCFVQLLTTRLADPSQLQDLDLLLGRMINRVEQKLKNESKLIV